MPEGDVHIWWTNLVAGRAACCASWDLLSEEEKQVATGRRPAKSREFILGRALLRQILAAYVDRAPAELHFDSNAAGKPVLRGIRGIHFNLSHSQNLLFIAVAHRRIGIDVEYIQPAGLRKSEIEQYLSPFERIRLEALPAKARAGALIAYWSQKEAVLKAAGIGLLFPPQRVNVTAVNAEPRVVHLPGGNWLVRQIAAPAGYAAAVAIEQADLPLCWRQWRIPLEGARSAIL